MGNRVAIVTGGARGIGRAIALELAAKGSDIIVNDYILEKEALEVAFSIQKMGVRSRAYVADVSSKGEVREMVSSVENEFGHIDILVNNAGISPKYEGAKRPVYEMDPDEWERVIQVNLTGAFYCTRFVAPLMMERRWGRIVNISSMAGRIYSPISGAHYCASKAGIIGLTRVCAGELAPFNILVNAVAPGRIETPMMRIAGDERNSEILKSIPLGKFGEPEDVAKIVGFLASDDNQYIVGTTIDVNGGRMML